MQNLEIIKEALKTTYQTLDVAEKMMCWEDKLCFRPLSEEFKNDILNFVLYLAASDKKITSTDRDIINGIFDENKSTTDYADMVRVLLNPDKDSYFGYGNKRTIPDIKFEDRVPLSAKTAMLFDASYLEGKQNLTSAVIDVFEMTGKFFLLNNPIETNETSLNSYVQMLRKEANDLIFFWSGYRDENQTVELDEQRKRKLIIYARRKPDNYGLNGGPLAVGCNIPEGKYMIYVRYGEGSYSVLRKNKPIISRNIKSRGYVDLRKFDELDLNFCYAISIEDNEWFSGKYLDEGEYIVGKDIEEGTYVLQAKNKEAKYSLERFADDGTRIVDEENSSRKDIRINVKRGQILVIFAGIIDLS